MAWPFDFSTLQVEIEKSTRSLIIYLHRPLQQNAINHKMLEELETIFSWPLNHLEVNTIVLSSQGPIFSVGTDAQELESMEISELKAYLQRLQKLIYSMFFLPQTIVANLKGHASGMGVELVIGADIRVMAPNCQVEFDYLFRGLVPACGGIGMLAQLVAPVWVKNWLQGPGGPIDPQALVQSGFISAIVERPADFERILQGINQQAPVARIQAKRACLEHLLPGLDLALAKDSHFAFAALMGHDWQKAAKGQAFVSAREMAKSVQEFSLQTTPLPIATN